MSKICEKCGNVIPEGESVCPNCGREDYNDEVLQGILSELGLDFAEGGSLEPELEDLSQSLAKELESVQEETPEETPEATMVFDPEAISEAAEEPAEAPEEAPMEEPEPVEAPAPKLKKVQKKRPVPVEEPVYEDEYDEDDYEEVPPKKQKKSKKQKKPMKKHSAAIVGVVIGLVAALLIIAGVVGFMLYQLGFFNQMSDDELLGTTTQTPVETFAPAETPAESPAPAASVVEEQETSAEEPVVSEKPEEKPVVEVDKFTVTGASTITLYTRGETAKVSYIIEPAEAESAIEWKSDDELVAKVSADGTIQARRGGVATITGTVGDLEISVSVVCDFEVDISILDMNMEDITMNYEGQTVQLAVDYDLTKEQIAGTVWESSDSEVATVDDEGVVTAVGNGTAVISATIGDYYTASCIVRCQDVAGNKGFNSDESEYTINYQDVTLSRKGEYFQLTLTSILGKDVPSFTWQSDDPSVATVDSKGVVTAVGNGTAYITATVGGDNFRCIVRVSID